MILDLGVVLGTADQSALPEKIQARIADMRPICIVGLNDARHASRSRRLQHRELAGIRSQGLMCAHHRILEELERILSVGVDSCWKRSMNSRTAIWAAISPPASPPMPSATTSSSVSRLYVYARRSWLT